MIVYYPDKLTINNETLFIVTAYFKEPHQEYLLETCINRIKTFHPDSDILVLNDTGVQEKLGEINAYLWAAEHIYSYKNFIFIHDSVFLINRLPIPEAPFSPLWFSSEDMKDNTHGEEIEFFLKKFHINNRQIHEQIDLLRNNQGSLVFGSMAVFNSEFIYFLKNNTNFLNLAYLFNSRHMRSFFERVIYIIANEFYKGDTKQYSICGNIFNHKRVFKTACSLDSLSAGNPYALKVWQGR